MGKEESLSRSPQNGVISRPKLESIQPRKAAIELTRKEGSKIRIYVLARSIVFLPVPTRRKSLLSSRQIKPDQAEEGLKMRDFSALLGRASRTIRLLCLFFCSSYFYALGSIVFLRNLLIFTRWFIWSQADPTSFSTWSILVNGNNSDWTVRCQNLWAFFGNICF